MDAIKEIEAAPIESYSPEDRAFHAFWYGHMLNDLMQPPLANVAHSDARYIWDAALAARDAEIKELKADLQFVERWANHHGQKPHMTPQETLSCIQHYPSILEITRSYADGKVPETRNPYAEIERLKAGLKELIVGYVSLLETGRDRIIEHGGQCDTVEKMEASDPYLRTARAALNPTQGANK